MEENDVTKGTIAEMCKVSVSSCVLPVKVLILHVMQL
jgi:hypothetical protein